MSEIKTYYAMAVPTFFRNRLRRLPRDAVVGTYTIEGAQPQSFDVVLLSPTQLYNARQYLGHALNAELEHRPAGGPVFHFVPQDIRQLVVPTDAVNPRAEATAQAARAFGLDVRRTIYHDGTNVVASLQRPEVTPLKITPTGRLIGRTPQALPLHSYGNVARLAPTCALLAGLRPVDPHRRRDRFYFAAAPTWFRPMSPPNQLQA